MISLNKALKQQDIKSILLWFVIAIYPFIVIPGPLDFFRGPRYVFLAVVGLMGIYVLYKERFIPTNPVFIPLAFFIFLIFLSAIFSGDTSTGFVGSSTRYTGLTTYFFCVVLFFLAYTYGEYEKIFKPMIYAAAIVAIIGILQFYGYNFVPDKFYDASASSTMGNTNWLATYLVIILPTSILLYIFNNDRRMLITSGIIYAGLLVSLTRGAWLAFFAAFCIICIYIVVNNKNRENITILIIVMTIITGILLSANDAVIYKRAFSIRENIDSALKNEGQAGSNRVEIWNKTLAIAKDNLIFGVGPDQLEIDMENGGVMDKAHNIYLEILATMGLPALISFLAFMAFFLQRWRNEIGFIFFIVIVTYLLQGLFNNDVILVMPIFWIIIGLALANRESVSHKENPLYVNGPAFYGVGAALFGIIIAMAVYFNYPSYGTVSLPGGEIYTGELRGNTLYGQGTLESTVTGLSYTGNFRYGRFDGEGKLILYGGSIYEGMFSKGQMHGEGKMTLADGKVIEGIWRNGIYQE